MRIYGYQLEKYIFPAHGSVSLRDIHRAHIEACLSRLKQKGHATSTLRSVRATFSTVLQSAVERGYLEKNPAHGIRIREADTKKERRFYSPAEIRRLLAVLTEPCRTVVSLGVLTGLRIGEILGLRWKRIDLPHFTLEVAENYSSGEFGSPKTKSSRRVIPISSALARLLENHRAGMNPASPCISHAERHSAQRQKPVQPGARASVRSDRAAADFVALLPARARNAPR